MARPNRTAVDRRRRAGPQGFLPVKSALTDSGKWRCPICWRLFHKQSAKVAHQNSFACLANYYTGDRGGMSDA